MSLLSDDQRLQHDARLQRLVKLLEGGAIMKTMELAEALQVTQRTIHRYIVELREMGHAVEGSPGAGGGIRLKPAKNGIPADSGDRQIFENADFSDGGKKRGAG